MNLLFINHSSLLVLIFFTFPKEAGKEEDILNSNLSRQQKESSRDLDFAPVSNSVHWDESQSLAC